MSTNMDSQLRGTRQRMRGRAPAHSDGAVPLDPANLYLAAPGAEIHVCDALNHPLVAQLLVEDMCWRAARAEWLARRPGRMHRPASSAWRAEGLRLDEKRERIADLADELGITPTPARTRPWFRWWG